MQGDPNVTANEPKLFVFIESAGREPVEVARGKRQPKLF